MRAKLLSGAAALAVAATAILCGGGPASASGDNASMFYSWGGQFPWDQPGRVNPDVISGPLLATSVHWPALPDYGFYQPTYFYACQHTRCRHGERSW